jgi:hypothetical protein
LAAPLEKRRRYVTTILKLVVVVRVGEREREEKRAVAEFFDDFKAV